MTVPRLVAIGVLLAAVLLVGAVLVGDGPSHRYELRFQTAGQLVKGDDVQVGGRRIGSVEQIRLTDDNEALITIGLNEFGPLHAAYRRLRQGLLSFETRHCGRPAPQLVDDSQLGAFPADLAANVRRFVLGTQAVACVAQGEGFPHVTASPAPGAR